MGLVSRSAAVARTTLPNVDNATWGMTCNMTGGASGGPWLKGFSGSTGIGTLASLNSYRYSFSNRMYGPKFNAYTQAVYAAADQATGSNIAVP